MKRRVFLQTSAAVTAASAASAQAPSAAPVRLGMVGVGNRGTSLLRTLLDLPNVEIAAVNDVDDNALTRAQNICIEQGREKPDGYARGTEDFRRLVERDDLDAVITAAPWEWHVPVMLAAMDAGKYVASEVPVATTVEDCWALIEKSETTGVHATMLENWVFRREPLAALNIARAGLLGEVFHCESGYGHDVRFSKFDARRGGDKGHLMWRGRHSVDRNGILYPTHQFAPIAMLMDVNHGARIESLVAVASPSRGMNQYAADRWGPDHPSAKRRYANGDRATALLNLNDGRTIMQFHDTQSWHPRDDGHKYEGTEGMIRWPFPGKGSIWVQQRHWDGKELDARQWHPLDPFLDEFDHAVWKRHGERALQFGHNGADWLELRAFVEAIRAKAPPPVPLADAVAWSSIGPVSEQSIARRGQPVEMPDFTRGKWRTNPKFEVRSDW